MDLAHTLPNTVTETGIEQQLQEAQSFVSRDPVRALELASVAMKMASALEPTAKLAWYARALRVHGIAYGAAGDMESCGRDLDTAYGMAVELNDTILQASCLHGLANVHNYRGEFALALEQMHRSNQLRRDSEDTHGLMSGLSTLGAFLAEMGDLADAVDCFTEALQIARRFENRSVEAVVLNNIAHAKLVLEEWEEALAIGNESLRLTQEFGFRVYETYALETVCKSLFALKRFTEALALAEQSLRVSRDLGNPHFEVNALDHIALVQIAMGLFAPAEEALLQALEIAREAGAGRRMADLYHSLGHLYTQTGAFERAHEALDQSIAYAVEREQKQLLCDVYQSRSRLYVATGDYKSALEAYETYFDHYKTLQRDKAQNKLVAQLARLEVERAQQEIELQRLRNGELAETNRQNAELLLRLQERANQLAEMAITDPLTGLYNRRYLQQYLIWEFDSGHRHPERPVVMAVALADLDNFKQVNDRFSHKVGDEVLKAVARLIQGVVRRSDVVIRFGGEEFVVLFPEMRRHDAMIVCERIRIAIADHDWESVHTGLRVSTSIGIADTNEYSFPKDDTAAEMEWLLGMADKRLYRAKELGKNRII